MKGFVPKEFMRVPSTRPMLILKKASLSTAKNRLSIMDSKNRRTKTHPITHGSVLQLPVLPTAHQQQRIEENGKEGGKEGEKKGEKREENQNNPCHETTHFHESAFI